MGKYYAKCIFSVALDFAVLCFTENGVLNVFQYQVIVLGPRGSGKTQLALALSDKKFIDCHLPTIGIDFQMIKLNDYQIKVWDSSSYDKFSIVTNYYSSQAKLKIVVYDPTQDTSIADIKKYIPVGLPQNEKEKIICVETKSDLKEESLNAASVKKYLADQGMILVTCSALTKMGILRLKNLILSKLIDKSFQEKEQEIKRFDEHDIKLQQEKLDVEDVEKKSKKSVKDDDQNINQFIEDMGKYSNASLIGFFTIRRHRLRAKSLIELLQGTQKNTEKNNILIKPSKFMIKLSVKKLT